MLRENMAQLNEEILAEILERYKEKLPEIRPNEIYKWRATKKFQDAWDPHAENVAAMLEEALTYWIFVLSKEYVAWVCAGQPSRNY